MPAISQWYDAKSCAIDQIDVRLQCKARNYAFSESLRIPRPIQKYADTLYLSLITIRSGN